MRLAIFEPEDTLVGDVAHHEARVLAWNFARTGVSIKGEKEASDVTTEFAGDLLARGPGSGPPSWVNWSSVIWRPAANPAPASVAV